METPILSRMTHLNKHIKIVISYAPRSSKRRSWRQSLRASIQHLLQQTKERNVWYAVLAVSFLTCTTYFIRFELWTILVCPSYVVSSRTGCHQRTSHFDTFVSNQKLHVIITCCSLASACTGCRHANGEVYSSSLAGWSCRNVSIETLFLFFSWNSLTLLSLASRLVDQSRV